ncbi:Uncharacterized protein FWK35_00027935 [Aphis craccivora]|uniref:Reverse transcriptase domain-containing protein n=1 Tax=Aphis craccivora TaxID=307492 RepID=A0A6G0W125_APHCR|nr:Uncharacterized protein FWK35_00027935 [Aphis craccivora]
MFQKIFNQCMIDGVFPKPWKRARLVLLRKGNKPADQPLSYHPLCMLDTTGKLFERIVCNRIEEALDKERTGLAENQYGFRKGRSTIDAIQRVLTEVTEAGAGTIYQRQLCVLVTLDVANAFNSASWAEIINAMRNKNVPNLTRLIQNYFRDREIKYSEEHEAVQLSSGVPQGSVLGPLLWGVMYDSLLTTETPEGVTMMGFADVVAIIGRAWRIEHLEEIISEFLRIANEWIISKKLRLALHKTEAVMLTRKRAYHKPTFVLGDQQITTKNSLRYLGVEIDTGRRFAMHEKIVGAKATKTAQAFSRILLNVGGSTTSKRKLLTSVVHSQFLYAAPIWAPALGYRPDRNVQIKRDTAKHIKSAQRIMALRVSRAYRTVSYEAAILISSMIPIKLLAEERCIAANSHDKRQAYKEARKCSLCEVDIDDSNHTLFECDAFENWRRQLYGELGCQLTTGNMIGIMLGEKKTWHLVSPYINRLMEHKCEAERMRKVEVERRRESDNQ